MSLKENERTTKIFELALGKEATNEIQTMELSVSNFKSNPGVSKREEKLSRQKCIIFSPYIFLIFFNSSFISST